MKKDKFDEESLLREIDDIYHEENSDEDPEEEYEDDEIYDWLDDGGNGDEIDDEFE